MLQCIVLWNDYHQTYFLQMFPYFKLKTADNNMLNDNIPRTDLQIFQSLFNNRITANKKNAENLLLRNRYAVPKNLNNETILS